MKRCQERQRRRSWATSGRSCSAALRDFFMPEADPAERVMDRRQRGHDTKAAVQLGLELGQRDVRRRLDERREVGFIRFEERPAMPTITRRRDTAGLAHPAHQLDRGRRADLEAPCGRAPRAAALDRTHDPLAQISGHRCRHHTTSAVSTEILESQLLILCNPKMLLVPVMAGR